MKSIIILLLTSTLFGCADTSTMCRHSQFYRPGDVCIRDGEKWHQLPNGYCNIDGRMYPEAICVNMRGGVI